MPRALKSKSWHLQGSHRAHGTASRLINPPKHSGIPDFRKILPTAMKKLVAEGLFEPDGLDDTGAATYKITAKGLARLQELS